MRLTITIAALLLSSAAIFAQAAPHVDYIPAPTAKSPGRAAVVAQLRKLGKEQVKAGKEQSVFDAEGGEEWDTEYAFTVQVLLDSPALFSLDTTAAWMPNGRSVQGARTPYVFDMSTGRPYDIGQLYRVRNPKGGLMPAVLTLVVRHTDPTQLDAPQDVADAVIEAFSKGTPQLFVSKKGIEVWPEYGLTWLDSTIIPWAELRPYLNEAEAKRIGWTAH
jgi:hypothetical protein